MKVKLGKFGDLPFQTFSFEVYKQSNYTHDFNIQ